eukprot:TRINITY_DN4410_c0_g1_i7.p1 TRINITY_DN4410_c0_g1~~TRINITY_DN4410_c0_g1_i7.p1  ORF type:complete len:107 (+),score=8.64 TRINITY_DN4410_c0_g1_i7:162-482(+)
MLWPDGYSFSGRCVTEDITNFLDLHFIEEPIHPKIKECLENNMCTRFTDVVGPQMVFRDDMDETYCFYCKENCVIDQEGGENMWSSYLVCECRCKKKIKSKRREKK